MRLVIIGPGRAGMSVAIAAHRAGAEIVGLAGRGDLQERAAVVDASVIAMDATLPSADLVVVAVRDDAIRSVSDQLTTDDPVVHLSGAAGLDVLAAHSLVGSFHPLQTLPDPLAGADQLAGAHVAIDAPDAAVADRLEELAALLSMTPFRVAPEHRALYHAAAAAASNFVITALALAEELFDAADIDPRVAAPLSRAVVANAYQMGPAAALTGPVARGDVATVAAQLAAIDSDAPATADGFRAFVIETARLAGTSEAFQDVVT